MKLCHVCNAECEDSAELCPVCGAELLEPDEETEDIVVEIENPVLAASVEDVVTAEIYCDQLSQAGILYSCDETEADAGMKLMFGGSFNAMDIYVSDKDLEEAQQIYNDVLNSQPEFEEFEEFSEEE